jgi:hypothetical protein
VFVFNVMLMFLFFRDHIPEWVTNEAGQAVQKQVWDELLVKLDKIEPGLPSRVIADWA